MSNTDQGFRVGAPNAESIARRNAQLQQWAGSDTDNIDLRLSRIAQIQFQRKFMFLDSVIQQDDSEVQKLLGLGVDVNYTNSDGISALHQVCIDGNAEIADILLKNSPNINAPDNDGWTPLHAAAQCGFVDLARLLLEAGADIACVDNEGQLPIDKAEEDDMRQLLAGWMRKKGINLDQVRTAEERSIREACDKVVRGRSKELEVVTVDGATILHCAAAKGLPDCITMLSRAGINLNIQDNDGWTPLHAAARWAQPEAIVALIENGADIHIVNTYAETPLDLADEDVLDLIKEYYERNPPRAKPIVPGVEKFLNPSLPDAITIIPITKGSRKLRDKENRPEKLPKTITETPKKEDAKIEPQTKPRPKISEPAAAVESKPGPASQVWQARNNKAAEKEAPSKKQEMETRKQEVDSPARKQSVTAINTDDSATDKAEVVRKVVSRRKRDERRPTQAVTLDDINSSEKKEEKNVEEEQPTKHLAAPKAATPKLAPPKLVAPKPTSPKPVVNKSAVPKAAPAIIPNGPEPETEPKKQRHAPVTVSITDSGAVVWENKDSKKTPESEPTSPGNTESASDKAEVVRKKIARKKRDERRSTQHVSQDDLPGTPQKQDLLDSNDASSKEQEASLVKELELEKKRFGENAEALARNQEDLRKRELKICALEKDNETMKKKIADLEEDLRRLQQVSSDNQRLRDENAALIRVIGKLSRNPL